MISVTLSHIAVCEDIFETRITNSLNNVTRTMVEPISIIQIEHRIPYHESYQTVGQPVDAVLASNVTQSELNDAYRNVLLMTPSG